MCRRGRLLCGRGRTQLLKLTINQLDGWPMTSRPRHLAPFPGLNQIYRASWKCDRRSRRRVSVAADATIYMQTNRIRRYFPPRKHNVHENFVEKRLSVIIRFNESATRIQIRMCNPMSPTVYIGLGHTHVM